MRNCRIPLYFVAVLLFASCAKEVSEEAAPQQVTEAEEIYELIHAVDPSYTLKDVQANLSSALEKNGSCISFTSADLSGFLACYGQTSSACLCYDYTYDGGVSSQDLSYLLAHYGTTPIDYTDLDIGIWWFQFNHWQSDIPTSMSYNGPGLPLNITISGVVCDWDDIKANCCVEWLYNGQLVSGNKNKMNYYEAYYTNQSLCRGVFPLTCRITHLPSGKVFERSACCEVSVGVNYVDPPWCGPTEQCGKATSLALGDYMSNGPYAPFEFCVNCD